jgi:ATP-dependent DNA helicase RecQ
MIKDAALLLKKYFGYENFRAGQEEIIESVLMGNDTFAVMPTGAGKSCVTRYLHSCLME